MTHFNHLNNKGEAHMVDIVQKKETQRQAVAQATVVVSPRTLQRLTDEQNPKGDVLAIVRIAGIQGAKKCSDLIPLCHQLSLKHVSIDIQLKSTKIIIETTCKTTGETGVEMEALTAASVAALTLYDMCKAQDKGMVIENTRLISKSGGKSGDWTAKKC